MVASVERRRDTGFSWSAGGGSDDRAGGRGPTDPDRAGVGRRSALIIAIEAVASDQPQSPRATLAQGRTRKPRPAPGRVGRRTRPCDMVCAPFRAGETIRG